jgi:hypothetical protein
MLRCAVTTGLMLTYNGYCMNSSRKKGEKLNYKLN